MRMIQRSGVSQKQKMSRRTIIVAAAASSILAIIAVLFFVFNIGNVRHGFAAPIYPKLDAKLILVSNDGSTYKVKLVVASPTANTDMGSVNFVFSYNTANLSFPNNPKNGTDYSYINFNSSPYYPGTVTNPKPGYISVNILNTGGKGGVISNGFVDVCTISFKILNPTGEPGFIWKMSESGPDKLNAAFDDNYINFQKGTFAFELSNSLAVSQVQLSANLKDNQVELNWSSSLEVNTNYFVIQRSTDGTNFDSIQTMSSAGMSKTTQSYQAFDKTPLPNTSYYRIVLVNQDHSQNLSNIVSVENNSSLSNINSNPASESESNFGITSISPTTFRDNTNINYKMPKDGNAKMVIVGMQGKTVLEIEVPSTLGANTYHLQNIGSWKPGTYAVSMYYEGQMSSAKMIKE